MNSWMLKYSKWFISGSYMGNCLLCSALPGILIQSKHRFNTTFECISSLLFFTCFVLDSLPVKTHNPVVTFEKTAGRFCFLKPSRNNVNLIPLLKPLNSEGFSPFSESPCCFPSCFTFNCYPSPSSSSQPPLTAELLLLVPASPTCSYQ